MSSKIRFTIINFDMMIKANIRLIFLLSALFIGPLTSPAQALLSTVDGVPQEPDASAALEIYSDNAGLLVPFVALNYNDLGNIEAPGIPVTPADGLIIFHDGSNNIDKGLWYYDATLPGWVIYSDFSSTMAETGLDDFGEMYEANELGSGTPYDLDSSFFNPWESAAEGLTGSAFNFLDHQLVNTETGTAYADQFMISGLDAVYSVVISATLAATAPSTTVTGALFLNDVMVDHIFFRHTFQLKDKPTSLSTIGNIEIHDGDRLDFRFTSDVKNKGVEIENLNVRFTKMGEL